MAEQTGRDLMLQLMERVGSVESELREMRTEVRNALAQVDSRLAAQNDAFILVASTIQQLT